MRYDFVYSISSASADKRYSLGHEMKLWRGQPENWKPTGRDKALFWLGIGAVFYVLALTSFVSPSQSSYTGRWGWLHAIFFGMFGASGDIILYSCLGTAAMLVGVRNFRAMQ